MGRRGIEVIEKIGPDSRSFEEDDSCPACGAPHGKDKCSKCGWSVEDLGAPFSDSVTDPVGVLRDARINFKRMKEEYDALRRKNELLVQNNQKFSELVEAMEATISKLQMETGKKYAYSYGRGGWGEAGEDGKMFIRIGGNVTVDDINRQLSEILNLTKRYRK